MWAFRARLSRAVTLLPTARSHSRYAARPPLSQCWPTGARTVHAETGGKGSRFFALKGDTVELATAIFTPSLLVFTALSGWAALTIARERFVWLENAEEAVYQNHFAGNPAVNMTRGQLKKLLSAGRWMTCEADTTVITNRGKEQPLVLLLNGTARIASTATMRAGDPGYHVDGDEPLEHEVVIERGRGLYGEVSFLHSMTARDEPSAARDEAGADVQLSAGSQYILWEGAALRKLLWGDRALANAFNAFVAITLGGKLYDATRSVGQASANLHRAAATLEEAEYARAAVGVALLTLVDTIHSVSESVRRAGGVTGELTTALTGPGTGTKLHASLDQLRRNQAACGDAHERVITRELGGVGAAAQRDSGPSLLEESERVARYVIDKHAESEGALGDKGKVPPIVRQRSAERSTSAA